MHIILVPALDVSARLFTINSRLVRTRRSLCICVLMEGVMFQARGYGDRDGGGGNVPSSGGNAAALKERAPASRSPAQGLDPRVQNHSDG